MKILDQLLGRGPAPSRESGSPDLDAAQQIVGEFACFLEISAPLPGRLADASELPHDKQAIKDALGACISATGDPQLIEQLKYGYLMLCAWQPGVGQQHIGVDFARLDLEAPVSAVAEQIEQQAGALDEWNLRILNERKTMAFDLMALGV